MLMKCSSKCVNSASINVQSTGQNDRHFEDDIFKYIFMKEKFHILIQISLDFVPRGPIENMAALVKIMSWCRTGDMLLPEPMFTQFTGGELTHWGLMTPQAVRLFG